MTAEQIDLPHDPNARGKRKRGPDSDREMAKRAKSTMGKVEANMNEDVDSKVDVGINNAFSNMDSQLLADYVAGRTRKFESDLSSVELEDRYIPANLIRDTKSWDKPRHINNLPAFLEEYSGNSTKLWSASKKNGAPHTIIVAAAGIRAANLARVVRKFVTKDVTVGKLFAKHIKLKDSISFLKSTRIGIGIGTPSRLSDLMKEKALAIDRLERIVIDSSYVDQKKRGILEIKDTHVALMAWLGQKELKERYGLSTEGVQLLFY